MDVTGVLKKKCTKRKKKNKGKKNAHKFSSSEKQRGTFLSCVDRGVDDRKVKRENLQMIQKIQKPNQWKTDSEMQKLFSLWGWLSKIWIENSVAAISENRWVAQHVYVILYWFSKTWFLIRSSLCCIEIPIAAICCSLSTAALTPALKHRDPWYNPCLAYSIGKCTNICCNTKHNYHS